MTDRPTIPEEFREDIEALRRLVRAEGTPKEKNAFSRIYAAAPPKRPTFTDDEALAFYRAAWPPSAGTDRQAIEWGHDYLDRLAAAGWTAPPTLCPPIPVDEVEQRLGKAGWRLRDYEKAVIHDVLRDLNRERGHG